jgi:hypothetical protein
MTNSVSKFKKLYHKYKVSSKPKLARQIWKNSNSAFLID